MSVTCSTSFFARLLFALRNPCTRSALPRGRAASSRACASKAMAPISASTLRRPPASSCSDSCASLNSSAATPAGVWRSLPSSSSRPLSSRRFSANIRAALHHRLGFLLLHHRRRGGYRLVHLGDRVGELAPAPVLEAVHRAGTAFDQPVVALDHGGHLLALVGMDDEN